MTKRVRLDKDNTISLYDLPKDILVHMISTIERDTREPLAARLAAAEEELGFMKRAAEPLLMHYEYCPVEGCLARIAHSDYTTDDHREHCQHFWKCELCEGRFCNQHLTFDQLCPGCLKEIGEEE